MSENGFETLGNAKNIGKCLIRTVWYFQVSKAQTRTTEINMSPVNLASKNRVKRSMVKGNFCPPPARSKIKRGT